MEAIFFAIDIVGVVMVLYWSIINDDRKPGTPTTGLFAYHEAIGRGAKKKDGQQPPTGRRPPPGRQPGLGRRPPLGRGR